MPTNRKPKLPEVTRFQLGMLVAVEANPWPAVDHLPVEVATTQALGQLAAKELIIVDGWQRWALTDLGRAVIAAGIPEET